MTLNEYQQEYLKTMPKNLYRGEQALDIYSLILYDGQPLDKEEVCLRLSHLARNLAICADAFDYDLEAVLNRALSERKED